MKRTLGLDLGTNSIGWALVEHDSKHGTSRIVKMGSRIVPMDGAEMSNFKKGLPQTKNAQKREKKSIRVGNRRYKQRRNKLIYVLQMLGLLPDQVKISQPFDNPLRIQKVNVLPVNQQEAQLTGKEFLQLRVKALTKPVSNKEFGRILYRFNQLRGYSGGDDGEVQDELNEVLGIKNDKKYLAQESRIQIFKIVGIRTTDEMKTVSKKQKIVFELKADGGVDVIQNGTTTVEGLIVGESIELKQTIRRNSKTGEMTSVEFSIPKKTGWRKKMENFEDSLIEFSVSIGRDAYLSEYFLECVNENEWFRVRDNVILRSRYMEEFDKIWNTQWDTHLSSVSHKTIKDIAQFLFPGNSVSQQKLRASAIENGIKYIIKNQIIYFQRPLKDQSHLISNCRFEENKKAVAKSHPLFQEYKIWEQINKLSINRKSLIGYRKNGKAIYKYQERPISVELKEHLFEELQSKQKISFKSVFSKLFKYDNFDREYEYFNGLNQKTDLIGNTTRITLNKMLGRFWKLLEMESIDNQINIWHLLYNGKGNEYHLDSDRNKNISHYLKTKGIKDKNLDKIIIAISCIKFPRDYASISLEVISKALPLIRAGKYFDNSTLSDDINTRLSILLSENVDSPFDKALQEYIDNNQSEVLENGGFVNAHALILLYGQHTEKELTADQLIQNHQSIKPLIRHSLRNPLVEQMINETLMVVKEIWKTYGELSEIKIELARELQNSKKQRKKMHESNEKSRKINDRIRTRLSELNQEISSGNIEKMKLWEEQGHIDPYTSQNIQLSLLFNKGLFDVDHIIPRSRYFDDSLGNKVVCARTVNKDKGNRTAMEYFDAGTTKCNLVTKEKFMENAVNKFFGKKRKYMLAAEIPSNPIDRQKKETQYITTKAKEELAKVVNGRSNVKISSGGVTHYLRNHWGVTNKFKEILEARFERYFKIKAENEFKKLKSIKDITSYLYSLADINLPKMEKPKFINAINKTQVIDQETFTRFFLKCQIFKQDNNNIIKGYSKRFDHRHHAIDALVVACTGEKAIKRLNDLNKHLQDWIKEKASDNKLLLDPNSESILDDFLMQESAIRDIAMLEIKRFRDIDLPWDGFLNEMKNALEEIIISHKPKDKLLIQSKEELDQNNILKKTTEKIIRIRGALHEETIYGLSNGYESYRIPISKLAGSKFDTSGNIEKITNDFLRKEIYNHFHNVHAGKKADAFGAEGLLELNKRLSKRTVAKNGVEVPVPHPPINSIKIYRKKIQKGNPYSISLQKLEREKSYNNNLYVNSGNNYLFAVLTKDGTRNYDILSLFNAVQLLSDAFSEAQNKDLFNKDLFFHDYFEKKNKSSVLFMLKQFDMVYLPNEDEDVILDVNSPLFKHFWQCKDRVKNIWTVTKFSGKQIYFLNHLTAEVIEKKLEFGSQNQLESFGNRKIVEHCLPISLNRLGQIVQVGEF